MLVSPSGRVMLARLEHAQTAETPMFVSPSDRVTSVRLDQW